MQTESPLLSLESRAATEVESARKPSRVQGDVKVGRTESVQISAVGGSEGVREIRAWLGMLKGRTLG